MSDIQRPAETMSSAQSETTLAAKLENLQCHFTWDLDVRRHKLLRITDKLQDIGTDEGNSWLGHIYNLQGYIHFQLGSIDDARSFFSRAAEAFRQTGKTDEGPWLVVNYGNLAWLHHHQGEEAESQACLSKVDTLIKEYPSPSQDDLHPEIYAEKAWTLMKFSREQKLLAVDYFQRAIRMQPDMVEWQISHVIGLANYSKHWEGQDVENLEKMRKAKEQNPDSLYLAARYLNQLAQKGEQVEDEARELARKILRNPVSTYSGWGVLLRVFRFYISTDEAIDLAEEALENHPDERYLKRCLALCYKSKILFSRDGRPAQSVIERAIHLHKEVISLYPHSSFVKRMDLANIYAKSHYGLAKADEIYQELLKRDNEPEENQVLYNIYARYLNFDRREQNMSIRYHMKAVEIPHESFFRHNSIRVLEKIRDRNRSRMCSEIRAFLDKLSCSSTAET